MHALTTFGLLRIAALTIALVVGVASIAVLVFSRRGGLSIPMPPGILGEIGKWLVFPVMAFPFATLLFALAGVATIILKWR